MLQRQELEALRVERGRAAELEKQVQDLAGDVERETEAKALLREVTNVQKSFEARYYSMYYTQ